MKLNSKIFTSGVLLIVMLEEYVNIDANNRFIDFSYDLSYIFMNTMISLPDFNISNRMQFSLWSSLM